MLQARNSTWPGPVADGCCGCLAVAPAVLAVAVQGREGKVTQVYRKKWVIHIERITREKVNGACLCWATC
jgi:hypothetical protein